MIRTASVGITRTMFVSMLRTSSIDAAAVAADESDGHPDRRGDDGGERADDEARAQAVDELREDVLPGAVVPSQYSVEGGSPSGYPNSNGVASVSHGPTIASTRKKSTTMSR